MSFRTGAVRDQEMVVVLEDCATKINAKATGTPGGDVGLDIETVLSVQAWVRRPGGAQYSWIDLHVFDDCDRLIRSETLALKRLSAAEDGGQVFAFEDSVHRGTGASPGSVWLAPDARKVQYRLYYEVDGVVFSDGLLRQHEVVPDSALTHCSPPDRSRRPTLVPAVGQ